jgi:hypothetical protein
MAHTVQAARQFGFTAAEKFWCVLGCIIFGAAYLQKVPVKRALADFDLVEMTSAESFWYVLGCISPPGLPTRPRSRSPKHRASWASSVPPSTSRFRSRSKRRCPAPPWHLNRRRVDAASRPRPCDRPCGRAQVREPVLRQPPRPLLPARGGRLVRGVLGRDLSNPIPALAEHGAERKVIPYSIAPDMNTDRARSTSASTPSCSGSST